ncbi:SigE family RNA polymerase sigma factor [Nocardioides bizhenqiangii]|uniref:SigE family RNA polymerase sigma factor n=1 Tax=Nocardioides bizhenqiangii TaxID=3095076 RepID=A0ABZ0ZT77_9ACTN|nr:MULTISPECIES: SigE family RNA polymerase sigma factor [unclassified Nocardioides]MDZ5622851.1 SigE family RNA polymerase sigma factor [Nocardioides sp. HM23]WQQ27109.1 SigE family RNA polymerase sigma factor [Nocardioides sp. HM61]
MSRDRDREFADFVRTHRGGLMTTARLLTAGDGHLAEDLVQTALVRVYLAWSRARSGNPVAYARRTLVNCTADHHRRGFTRREHSAAAVPETAAPVHASDDLDAELVAALGSLPPRMRAAVVLRHVHDLSVDDTAHALGCSVGTVKSQTARGLDKLRAALAVPTLEGDHR